MSKKLYRVSKYYKDCYCRNVARTEPLLIKFDASTAYIGIGIEDTYMSCPFCGNKRHFRIDTWWGGSFSNDDTIFLDTAKKTKLKVSELVDATNTLLENYMLKLTQEVNVKKKDFDDADKRLSALKDLIGKTKTVKKDSKSKNG